ncbi:cyclic nucleotide-binding domain-containing protein [uncultured Azohydromonas sp.]|uniref:cyclic nucleotide-binding domain-containing protein n=1 Tax=uncultured Azohydromonas sp. TaxID=487342 RepID=UPI00262F6E5B|nr:cyclic nucleotide-binding domain-containing protein [uncultured Azohydromonas sp.]
MKPNETRARSVSPGEVIISEGYVGLPAMYVIKDGQVEISVKRNDERIVLSTLGKGQFFGEGVLLSEGPRNFTAKALTYCELQLIEANVLRSAVDKLPALLRHMLRSLIQSNGQKDETLVQHENIQTQPEFLTYAHVLALMAAASGRRLGEESAMLPVADVVKKCRDVTGHARRHVAATLRHMAMLNLIAFDRQPEGVNPTIDSILGNGLNLRFNPREIGQRAQELARHNVEGQLRREQEIIELDDLAALTGVDRSLLLRKLAHGELADALFSFRRSEVLRFVAEKGKDYFAKRPRNAQLQSLADLMMVDQRILFDALNPIDEFDLAKLLQGTDDAPLRDKLLSCVGKAKRQEIEALLAHGVASDPEEAQHIEEQLLEAVRLLRQPAARQMLGAAVQDQASA